jgi:hypothetical protein
MVDLIQLSKLGRHNICCSGSTFCSAQFKQFILFLFLAMAPLLSLSAFANPFPVQSRVRRGLESRPRLCSRLYTTPIFLPQLEWRRGRNQYQTRARQRRRIWRKRAAALTMHRSNWVKIKGGPLPFYPKNKDPPPFG